MNLPQGCLNAESASVLVAFVFINSWNTYAHNTYVHMMASIVGEGLKHAFYCVVQRGRDPTHRSNSSGAQPSGTVGFQCLPILAGGKE
jgi:hypothetical protein